MTISIPSISLSGNAKPESSTTITEYRHVFTDLPQTSQGDDLQFFFRQNKTSQYKYVPNSLADLAMDNQNCPVRSQTSVLIITY